MTKKSYARQQRDALQKQTEVAYVELEGLYNECSRLLLQHGAISSVLDNKQLVAYLPDQTLVANNVALLSRDLGELHAELQRIHDSHKEKKGSIKSIDEGLDYIQISEHYQVFMEKHQGVVMPVVAVLVEEITKAEIAWQRAIDAEKGIVDTPVASVSELVDDNAGAGRVLVDINPTIQ